MIHRLFAFRNSFCALVVGMAVAPLFAQLPGGNPLPGDVPQGSIQIVLEDVIRIPPNSGAVARLEILDHAGDGTGRLFVADQHGKLYSFTPGDAHPTVVLDVAANAPDFFDGGQNGLRSFAFHPDHQRRGTPGFAKLYTAHSVEHQGADGADHDSIVAEWTLRPDGMVDTAVGAREVLRLAQPRGDHNIGRLAFNPNLDPGDSDYGHLYVALGDGGNFRTPGDQNLNPHAQDRTNLLGSIVRLHPLEDVDKNAPFSVPFDNPFANELGVQPEIWAYGLRNPHQFSWDTGGRGQMLIADIGQSNIEELNLGVSGANYGWPLREGTFDVSGKSPAVPMQVENLPSEHASDAFTYPVVQFDHAPGNLGFQNGNSAIAGGFVYRGGRLPELDGMYFFGSFANSHAPIYAVPVDELVFRDDFTDLATLHGGYLAPLVEVTLIQRGEAKTLLDIVREASGNPSLGRTDLRFGQDENGEIYVLNKHDGWVRRITAVPEPSAITMLVLGIACALWSEPHGTSRRSGTV